MAHSKTAVNLSMVYAYYEIGCRIYEEEQQVSNSSAEQRRVEKAVGRAE